RRWSRRPGMPLRYRGQQAIWPPPPGISASRRRQPNHAAGRDAMNQQLSQPPGDEASAPWNSPDARDKLFERTKNILLKPSAEWERIDQEPASISGIYRKHVFALAAVPVLAGLIGSLVFGYSALGITYRPPLVPTLVSAL